MQTLVLYEIRFVFLNNSVLPNLTEPGSGSDPHKNSSRSAVSLHSRFAKHYRLCSGVPFYSDPLFPPICLPLLETTVCFFFTPEEDFFLPIANALSLLNFVTLIQIFLPSAAALPTWKTANPRPIFFHRTPAFFGAAKRLPQQRFVRRSYFFLGPCDTLYSRFSQLRLSFLSICPFKTSINLFEWV